MSEADSLAPPALDHAVGDETGIAMPAHEAALREGGEAFLTQAFRTFGSLPPENRVSRITRLEPCPGGSTGHKLFLSVEYASDEPGLERDLFVKFSRDFADSRRDQGRYEMESEARFAAVSRSSGFPLRVPTAYFGDFHSESGTGLLITERVRFGQDGIEPLHGKCRDFELADPLAYYRALVTALARLAAAHKTGALTADIERRFPLDLARAGVDPIGRDEADVRRLVAHCRDFAGQYPRLLPANLREPDVYDGVLRQAIFIRDHEDLIRNDLLSNPDLVALCHWNAHIDNAWFWRDADRELRCGLMDWGRVSQITFGAALWGCLSAAHHDVVDHELDTLIALFVREYHAAGGPRLDVDLLKRHFLLHVGIMGLARVLAMPKVVLLLVRNPEQMTGPLDPRVLASGSGYNCLHIYTNLLKLWSRADFGGSLETLTRW
ncbi:hypothetical protein [Novosphingobium sp. M1R2S20]|uniref:Phosphotransferase family enzyme n=1 Tax=Novosphingobium rhizovicinum TaxID=3228928 RepID=A0ABV3R6W9_9SPHN